MDNSLGLAAWRPGGLAAWRPGGLAGGGPAPRPHRVPRHHPWLDVVRAGRLPDSFDDDDAADTRFRDDLAWVPVGLTAS
ncbi:hypothetical protein [Promicromonospora sp. NPDC019610]|uniref:hypothetical protein n=1 Tax=Promicromonospora sp. NPDC019610 TaxID=3364405 RepID=UPI0037B997FB